MRISNLRRALLLVLIISSSTIVESCSKKASQCGRNKRQARKASHRTHNFAPTMHMGN